MSNTAQLGGQSCGCENEGGPVHQKPHSSGPELNNLHLVISGNAPWPIGVTSVGIHERSSREKISHVTGMNVAGHAHVMNDEATRKYLQVPQSHHSELWPQSCPATVRPGT